MRANKPVKANIFDFTYDDAVILPNNRWAVDVNFRLICEGEKRVGSEIFYTLVCSPEFAKEPIDEYRDYIDEKTIIMDFLDKQQIEYNLQQKIDELNETRLAWKDYYAKLEQSFYVDD